MSGSSDLRAPKLYWGQIKQLKAASICMRLYRNSTHTKVKCFESVKAIASSGAVAGWLIWKDYPLVWTSIIACAQFTDAIKDVFPFSKQHKAASALTVALETIYIDAEDEWERIFAGKMTAEDINARRSKLRKLQIEAEGKHFPDGFDPSKRLIALATEEVNRYFETTFGEES